MAFENLRAAINDIAEGRMVILVDDEDRENEGDLCMAAELVTPDAVNFMATHGRGLICLTLPEDRIQALELPMMVNKNTSQFETGFTVSIEAREGVTTGISAADRARTILQAVKPDCTPYDLVRPGHIFPIRARDGGVLVRTGQTEGSVDLSKLAGLNASGVICEIMNEDGTMARRPELESFAKRHELRVVTIAEIIAYRMAHETLVETVIEREIETEWGNVTAKVIRSKVDQKEHLAIVKGTINPEESTLIRVQTVDLPADLIGLALSGGGSEMRAAMDMIAQKDSGVFVYLVRDGGDELLSEKLARMTDDSGKKTNPRLGGRMDLRQFGVGAQILKSIGIKKFRLMSNHDVRIVGIEGFDLEMTDRVPLPI